MKVSIVIATYNRLNLLKRGLYTIENQSIKPDEIIVIDDGSSDGTKEYFGALNRPWVKYRYLNHPEPRISCHARNVGIKQATGDVIIFTEPEALHIGNTIDQLLAKMNIYANFTILASQVWTTQKLIAEQLTKDEYAHPEKIITHPYAQLTTSSNLTNTNAPNSDWAITGEANCNAGVLFATRKAWIMKIGGFDESFTGHGWDDFDLFERLKLTGHGVLKAPEIAVIHQYHDKGFYPYNIYEHAERNGKISEERIHKGEYRANIGREWGVIE